MTTETPETDGRTRRMIGDRIRVHERADLLVIQRAIIAHGASFRAMLAHEREVLGRMDRQLQSLEDRGLAYGPQRGRNRYFMETLDSIDSEAIAIITDTARILPTNKERITECMARVELAVARWHEFRLERMAPLGWLATQLRNPSDGNCRGVVIPSIGERVGGAMTFLARILENRCSTLGEMQSLDRYVVMENGRPWLWIRAHDLRHKFQCMTFRIGLTREVGFHEGTSDLRIVADAFIPFGTFGDTARYPVLESEVQHFDEWVTTRVESNSYNESSSCTMQKTSGHVQTQTASEGGAEGRSRMRTATDNWNESEARSMGGMESESDAYSRSAHSGSNTGWQHTTSHNGAGFLSAWPDGSSRGRQFGTSNGTSEGSSISRAHGTNWNEMYNRSRGGSASDAEGVSLNRTYQRAASIADSLSESFGVTGTHGTALQVRFVNHGFDFSGNIEQTVFPKWRERYHHAAHVFDAVWAFATEAPRYLVEHQDDYDAIPSLSAEDTVEYLRALAPMDVLSASGVALEATHE